MTIPRWFAVPVLALPWVAAVGFVGVILVHRFPPNGQFVATTVVDGNHPFINPFLPSQRVSVPGAQPEGWVGQRIFGDPAYMTSRVPGPYEHVTVELEFHPVRQPLVEFGIVRNEQGTDLELRPMYASELEPEEWQKAEGGYVRRGVSPARLHERDTRGMAVWSASSVSPLLEDPASSPIETPVSLRGSHDFYLVPAAGSLDVTFSLQDVNRKRGTTIAAFRVFRGEEEIRREALTTNASRETTMGKVMGHRVSLSNLPPAVYRISIQADDDLFVRGIRTTSRRWVVGPRLNIGDVVGYATTTLPARAWTNSRHVIAETLHREGLQTVSLGPVQQHIARTHETYRLDRSDADDAPALLHAPAGDIRFVGDGWFAFRAESFFEPKPKRLTDGTDVDLERIAGVKTPYVRPEHLEDGWLRSRFKFALEGHEDRLRFILGTPGIASRAGAVDIRRITITYGRPPLDWDAWKSLLFQELKNAWRRL